MGNVEIAKTSRNRLISAATEAKRRAAHPYFQYVPNSTPKSNQAGYHASTAWCRLLFGGNRSGKSHAAAQDLAWCLCAEHPSRVTPKNSKFWLLSSEYRTLFEGVFSHLKRMLPQWKVERFGPLLPGTALPSFVLMKNGNRVDLISAEGGESARRRIQAAAIDGLYIDEEVDETVWIELTMRLIDRGGFVSISASLIRSEEWLLGLESRAENGDEDLHVTRLVTTSNQHLDQKGLKLAVDGLSEEEAEVRVHGRSRRATGLVYNGWDSTIHVIKPHPIPPEWSRYMAMDPGLRVTAVLWVAVGPDGRAVAYRELYLRDSGPLAAAEAIHRAEEGEPLPVLRIIDPSAYARSSTGAMGVGPTLAAEHDLAFVPANNDVFTGIEVCRKWMAPGKDGVPGFRVFNTLENFIYERSRYRIAPDKSRRDASSRPDQPLKKYDHLMDAWRYTAMARPAHVTHDSQVDIMVDQMYAPGVATTKGMSDRIAEMRALNKKREGSDLYMGNEF